MNVSGGSCDVRSIPDHTRELLQLHYSFYVKNVKKRKVLLNVAKAKHM